MSSGLPTVYLDTNIFQPWIYNSDGRASRAFAQEVLEDLRGDIANDNIDVKIPKPAMGELVDNFYADLAEYGEAEVGSWGDFSDNLETYLDHIEVTLCPVDQEVVATANQLIEMDGRLAGTDAVIAACALEDRWSSQLVTGDSDFHETNAIQDIDQQRHPTPRLESLNVRDNY
jgi:predicted nucleic acid-binding protein